MPLLHATVPSAIVISLRTTVMVVDSPLHVAMEEYLWVVQPDPATLHIFRQIEKLAQPLNGLGKFLLVQNLPALHIMLPSFFDTSHPSTLPWQAASATYCNQQSSAFIISSNTLLLLLTI